MIRVLLIEDSYHGRGGLSSLLTEDNGISVVGCVDIDIGIDADIVTFASRLWPDVLLVNTSYMVGQITPIIGDLRIRIPGCAALILSDPRKRGMLPPQQRTPGLNFIPKGSSTITVTDAIRRVAQGEVVIDTRLTVASITWRRPVTSRELEVLGLAARGEPIADIARRLSLSTGTVRNHISSAIAKTGARNRLDAIRILRRDGWLH